MMGDLLVGLGAGALAGAAFFGGLRWTVARLTVVRRPVLLAATSFLLRSALLVSVFLVMVDGALLRALAGLGGLLAVRTALVTAARRGVDPAEESSWT